MLLSIMIPAWFLGMTLAIRIIRKQKLMLAELHALDKLHGKQMTLTHELYKLAMQDAGIPEEFIAATRARFEEE